MYVLPEHGVLNKAWNEQYHVVWGQYTSVTQSHGQATSAGDLQ